MALLVGVATYLATWGGIELTRDANGIAVIWITNAIVVAALLRSDGRRWPELLAVGFVGTALATLLSGTDVWTVLLRSILNLSEALICAGAIRLLAPVRDFQRPRLMLLFYLVALGPACLVASLGASIGMAFLKGADQSAIFANYYPAHALGLVAITPMLLITTRSDLTDLLHRTMLPRLAGVFGVVAVTLAVVFWQTSLPLMFLVIPALLLATFALGFTGATVFVLLTWLVGLWATLRGLGPVALVEGDLRSKLYVFQIFAAVAALTSALAAVVLRERDILVAAFAQAPDLNFVKNTRGELLAVSQRAAELAGYDDPAGLTGRMLSEEQDRARAHQAEEREIMSTGGSLVGSVELTIDASGTTRWTETSKVALKNRAGRVIGLAGASRDITERTRTQQALEAAQLALLKSQKMESLGQLTGGVAHDFNNLLTVVMGNAEMLSARLEDEPQLARLASTIRTAAQNGSRLTQSLLAFARRQALEPRAFNVNETITAMKGLLKQSVTEEIEIEYSLAPDLRPAFADYGQLESALINLAVNARDAMPKGGKLTIETANAELDEGYSQANEEVNPGAYVMIAVTDNGIGMTREVQSRAFEPFFTTKHFGGGSGLGLSMVYGYAKQSLGHVKIYSEVGLGTSIKLYLPGADGAADDGGASTVRSETIQGGSERILVVEDEASVRDYIVAQLAQLGYGVTAVQDGTSALGVLRAETPFDLLLTDVVMPGGMNGRQLADAATVLFPKLSVLFMSGYTENTILHQGRLDHGVLLLNKPFGGAELARKVRQALDAEREATEPRPSGA